MSEIPFMKLEPHKNEPYVEAYATIAGDIAGRSMPKIVSKTWGYELHYKNDEDYCCKLLRFHGDVDQGISTSMHFHVDKHETLVVSSGTLTVEYIVDKVTHTIKLNEGSALVVCGGFPHRLMALDGPVDVFEASTFDSPDDSIRIA